MKQVTISQWMFYLLICISFTATSCGDDDTGNNEVVDPVVDPKTDPSAGGDDMPIYNYMVGIESGSNPAEDVLVTDVDITTGTISPVGNGYKQDVWTVFVQGKDQIFTAGYTSAPEFVSYTLSDNSVVKGGSFFTDLGIYAHDIIDESTMVLVGAPRQGLANKKIYLIDTDEMMIEKTMETNFGNSDDYLGFPTDAKVRGNKLYISYYLVNSDGTFSTLADSQAEVAVFSYPGLEFEKIIKDERAPNIGRYYSTNGLEIDESGDIYTFSPSSLACAFNTHRPIIFRKDLYCDLFWR